VKVDRTRFLLLTAAIASPACTPPAGAGGAAVVVPTLTPADSDASAPSPFEAANADAGAPAPSAQSACDRENAQGSPGDCSLLHPPRGPSCESFSDTKDACDEIKKLFLPKVAERAVACMLEKSGTRAVCGIDVAARCLTAAFRASCGPPEALARCTEIARKCAGAAGGSLPKVSITECQGAVGSVSSEDNRTTLLSCMNESCSSGFCYTGLE
jgi:hypothetical protein